MVVWRVVGAAHAGTAFSGLGAADHPGRWNQRGRRVVYASDTPSLAMLEILANAETPRALEGRMLIRAVLPDESVYRLPDEDLPADWRASPIPASTRDLGEAWREDAVFPALSVPSAGTPLQRNVLLNPDHPDFAHVMIDEPVPLDFDPHLQR